MEKRIAEIAIPISIAFKEVFDYRIPEDLRPCVRVGCRVLVPFRTTRVMGYAVRLKNHSPFESKLKPLLKNLDAEPVLDDELWDLARMIEKNYFCSLADAIRTVLPTGLKDLKKPLPEYGAPLPWDPGNPTLTQDEERLLSEKELDKDLVVIHDLTDADRWNIYSAAIRQTLRRKQSVIFLVPDHKKIIFALERLQLSCEPFIISSSIKASQNLASWVRIKNLSCCFVIGTRSAVFAPVKNCGCVIIDEEEHFAYRQDQVPHYRTIPIALAKAQRARSKVILGSFMPSLETLHFVKERKGGYWKCGALNAQAAALKLIDTRQERRFKGRERIISGVLEHRIAEGLGRKEKLLVFVNKKGFSTFLACKRCNTTQTCPRCSSSLVYHFREKIVSCPKCSYRNEAPDLCPACKSSYVKYSGYGIEKVESELLRLFPSSRIKTYTHATLENETYDIMLATQGLFEDPAWSRHSFETVIVLLCEQMLSHVDFRSTERTFMKLARLLRVSKKECLIQTEILDNHAFTALRQGNTDIFFEHEEAQRRELGLPPFRELAAITVRSAKQSAALAGAADIFKRLNKSAARRPDIQIYEPAACIPLKVRGNFRYQISIKTKTADLVPEILATACSTKDRGVIVTFDPTPP
jgi:primosomal protein N' (replication factor Y)